MSGKIVILSGPSGVGKDTVIDAWAVENHHVKRVVAYTTRSPREAEVDGVDYNFVTVDQFHLLAAEGAFLEHKEVHGNFYATPMHDLHDMVADGLIAILKIDVQGALDAMLKLPTAISVFLLPPDVEELEHRLRGRGTDDEEAIERRLSNARREIEMSAHYEHRVVNDDINEVVRALEALVR